MQELTLPIVGQSATTIDVQRIMDEGKILLVKLSPRYPYVTNLIGSLLDALLLNAAYNRSGQRRQFHLYADEFERFATEDFAELLEQARKYGIGITIAHQNRSQLSAAQTKLATDLKDRSRSAGSLVVFQINSLDAEDLAGERNLTPPPFTVDWVEVEEGDEPVRLLSPTPWDDLIEHGHPNPEIQAIVTAAKDLQAAYLPSPDSWQYKYPSAPVLSGLFFQAALVDDRLPGTKKGDNGTWKYKLNELLYTLMADKLQPDSAAFHTHLFAYMDDWLGDRNSAGWLVPPADKKRFPPSYKWIEGHTDDYTKLYIGGYWSEPQYTKAELMAAYQAFERFACVQFSLKLRYEAYITQLYPEGEPVLLRRHVPAALVNMTGLAEADATQTERPLTEEERASLLAAIERTLSPETLARERGNRWEYLTTTLVAVMHHFWQLCLLLTRVENQPTLPSRLYQPRIRQHPVIKQFTYPEMAKKTCQ